MSVDLVTRYVLVCDGPDDCDEAYEEHFESQRDALNWAKREGWTVDGSKTLCVHHDQRQTAVPETCAVCAGATQRSPRAGGCGCRRPAPTKHHCTACGGRVDAAAPEEACICVPAWLQAVPA